MGLFKRSGTAAALSLLGALSFSPAVEAGLLNNGTTTLNTDTGLEYLDLSFTNNSFPGAYLLPGAGFPPGRPVPAGFRPGTNAELLALFGEVGLAPELPFNSGPAFLGLDFLLDFIGALSETNFGSYLNRESFILTSTPNGVPNQIIGYQVRVLDFFAASSTDYGVLVRADGQYAQASATTATLHVRNKANATPGTALSASSSNANSQSFTAINGDGVWVNTNQPTQGELKLTGTAGNLIRAVGIAESFADSNNQVILIDPGLGEIVLNPGDVHTLSTPSAMVTLKDFDPALASLSEGLSPIVDTSLPLFVAFDTGTGDLLVADVPEPTTAALLIIGAAMAARRRR